MRLYRLFFLNDVHEFMGVITFHSSDEHNARAMVPNYADCRAMELWHGPVKVADFPTAQFVAPSDQKLSGDTQVTKQELEPAEIYKRLVNKPYGRWTSHDVLAARKILGLSQSELGSLIDYTRQGIGNIEGGNSRITRVFELAMRALLLCDFADACALKTETNWSGVPGEVSRMDGTAMGHGCPDRNLVDGHIPDSLT